MRKITLEKILNNKGVRLIATKKVKPFSTGDIIKLITPDGTYPVVFGNLGTQAVCDGCLFEDARLKNGIRTCPTFKDNSLLCVHTRDKDTRFMSLDSVLEDL